MKKLKTLILAALAVGGACAAFGSSSYIKEGSSVWFDTATVSDFSNYNKVYALLRTSYDDWVAGGAVLSELEGKSFGLISFAGDSRVTYDGGKASFSSQIYIGDASSGGSSASDFAILFSDDGSGYFLVNSNHVSYARSSDNDYFTLNMQSTDAFTAADLKPFDTKPGHQENPWKVGYPNEGDVVAYTNGTGTLVIEGTGDTWPDFLEKVPGWAYVADQITSVEIGEGVTSLGASAFDPFDPEISYQLLASVKFPSTLKSIGDCAFMLCSLADVTIPASVTNIGVMAFGGEGQGKEPPTPTLKSVTVLATVPPALGALAFASYADGFKINVPEGTAEAYKTAPGWVEYKDNIGGGAIDVASLYPDGDGAFVPATKATTHYGSLIGEDGVAGTITVKMTKPNMKGQFNLSATVNTLAGKQNYSFKASKVTVADAVTNANGALTFALVGSNKKAKAHTLAVTFGGDSLKGAFDGFAIDGARHVFSTSREPKREAVKPFAGTWTGSFADGVIAFSAKLAKNGNASVKVVLPDGTTVSSTAKAEVGAGGVIAVPVTVWKSLKAGALTFGFRLVFGAVDGKFVCQAADVSPLKMTDKRTGAVIASEAVKFDEAGLQTVTAKEFKTFAVALPEELTQEFGQPTRIALKMASTGLISGTVKFDKGSAKASGIVVNGKGVGLLTIKQDKVERAFVFSAKPAK